MFCCLLGRKDNCIQATVTLQCAVKLFTDAIYTPGVPDSVIGRLSQWKSKLVTWSGKSMFKELPQERRAPHLPITRDRTRANSAECIGCWRSPRVVAQSGRDRGRGADRLGKADVGDSGGEACSETAARRTRASHGDCSHEIGLHIIENEDCYQLFQELARDSPWHNGTFITFSALAKFWRICSYWYAKKTKQYNLMSTI